MTFTCVLCNGDLKKDEVGIYCFDCGEEYVMVDSLEKLKKCVLPNESIDYIHTTRIGRFPCNMSPVIVQKCKLKKYKVRSAEERAKLDARNEQARQKRAEKRPLPEFSKLLTSHKNIKLPRQTT
ncbi:hypothetical protein [Paenibacillus sp. TH7-28]